MNERIYEIFTACFPYLNISKEDFLLDCDLNDSQIIFEKNEEGETIGFCIIKNECLSLLCILPQYQKQGYGSDLLKKAEASILANGLDQVRLGYSDETSILFGVPLIANNLDFFAKRGYNDDFVTYDYALPLIEDVESNDQLTISQINDNTIDLFFEFLKAKNHLLYDKYIILNNIKFLIARQESDIEGLCAYKTGQIADKNFFEIYDLISFPNYNTTIKKQLLQECSNIAKANNCSELIIKNVSNGKFYSQNFAGKMKIKYWRGSKPCR